MLYHHSHINYNVVILNLPVLCKPFFNFLQYFCRISDISSNNGKRITIVTESYREREVLLLRPNGAGARDDRGLGRALR